MLLHIHNDNPSIRDGALKFLDDIESLVQEERVRISIITYSTTINILSTLGPLNHKDYRGLRSIIEDIDFVSDDRVALGAALQFVKANIWRRDDEDRANIHDLVVIFTGSSLSEDRTLTEETQYLKDTGVYVYIISADVTGSTSSIIESVSSIRESYSISTFLTMDKFGRNILWRVGCGLCKFT